MWLRGDTQSPEHRIVRLPLARVIQRRHQLRRTFRAVASRQRKAEEMIGQMRILRKQ